MAYSLSERASPMPLTDKPEASMFTKSIFTVSALALAVAFGATAQAQQAAQGGATRQIVVEGNAGAEKAPVATGAIEKGAAPLKAIADKPVVAEKAPVVAEKAPVVADKAPVVA